MKRYLAYFYTPGSLPHVTIRFFNSKAWCTRFHDQQFWQCFTAGDISEKKLAGWFNTGNITENDFFGMPEELKNALLKCI